MKKTKLIFGIAIIISIAILTLGAYKLFYKRDSTPDSKEYGYGVENNKIKYSFTIYIKVGIPESKILVLKSFVERQNYIQSVKYISAEQAIIDFRERHKNDTVTLQALEDLGSNPLGANLTVTITDASQKQLLINLIEANDKNNSIIDKIWATK